MLKLTSFILLFVLLSGCIDNSSTYESTNDARQNLVFHKGWLPDILPDSTYDLNVITSVEVSAGRGSFKFDSMDYTSFISNLSDYKGALSKIEDHNHEINRLLEEGYEPHSYASGSSDWIFLCNQKDETCYFFVW